ncbi:hypothetical protein J8273_2653 [Carpediemonas membranifera]|uniref:Uncharacterized protein n=1 Tax=Carpediemonas membranifera TaxID=201153 RepID=A0A8J6AVD9_9EUKA|nr:hypothetical protein J8273_2653 [Carpediemonas membranifera]|eukprot:KAG9395746.1 hypothetical protein J8273_2653 [Carpediemonas membranifera]
MNRNVAEMIRVAQDTNLDQIHWLVEYKQKEVEDSSAAPSELDLFPPVNVNPLKLSSQVQEDVWDPQSMPQLPPYEMFPLWDDAIKSQIDKILNTRQQTRPMVPAAVQERMQAQADSILSALQTEPQGRVWQRRPTSTGTAMSDLSDFANLTDED